MQISILGNNKKAYLLLNIFFFGILHAGDANNDWKISATANSVTAIFLKNSKIKVPLIAETGEPTLLSWEKIPEKKNVWALKYFAGASGTSTLIESYRQILIEMPDGKLLIDMPYEYKVLGLNAEEQKNVNQPKWEWSKKGLKITDKDYPSNNVFLEYKKL